MEERLAELLSRKLSGEATSYELEELEHWLQTHPGDQYFFDLLSQYWKNRNPSPTIGKSDADRDFELILQHAEEETATNFYLKKARRMYFARLAAAAACIAITVAAIFWVVSGNNASGSRGEAIQNEVIAKKGARSSMLLPDGTRVWLNSDSRIHFAPSFGDTVREVTLDGEAYFDVTKDSSRPFVVHTSDIDIRVLGTAFNVKSYPFEKTIETTLIHGLVEITKKNETGSSRIILRPKEKLVFNKPDSIPDPARQVKPAAGHFPVIAIVPLAKKMADSVLQETAWVYNRLVFEGDTFEELALKMERWYNVKISFIDDTIRKRRLRGAFEDETIDEALKNLQLITPFSYKKQNNEIEINHIRQ